MAVVSTPSGDVRKPCTFPFIYKGLQHQTCVTATDGNFWCFTETKPGGVGIPKSWGQCGPECPRDSYGKIALYYIYTIASRVLFIL